MTTLEVRTAFDQKVMKTFDRTPKEVAMGFLAEAYAAYDDRSKWLSGTQRIAVLTKLQELVRAKRIDLAKDAAGEGGKPWKDTLVEIDRGIDGIGIAIREIQTTGGTEIPMGITASSEGRWATTYHEPRGVVLAISAFNHPFNLIVHQAVTAFAAGCPVLVKPATTTPISCDNLIRLMHEAGCPETHCRMILTENEVTTEMVGDERVAFLTFIGSGRVGWMLRSKLSPGAACALEHGGVAPVIIDETADLDAAMAPLLRGGFYHAGQVCVSVQRIYIDEAIADDFIARYVEGAKKLKVGDPLKEDTEVGPLIATREVDRVETWVSEAKAAGGKVLCGGERLSDTTYAPTVIVDPPDDAKVSTDEIFGPVVCIYKTKNVDEGLRRANAPRSFFQASVFTQNLDTALRCTRELRGMAVMVNDHTAFRVDWMPFGGHLDSGLAAGGIGHSMRDMSLERMAVFKSSVL